MAASFSVRNVSQTSANIRVYPDSSYSAYRVYVRTSSGTTVFDQWYSGISYQFDAYVSGLTAGTSYVVNVAYNTSAAAAGSAWIGSQTFTTSAAVTYYYTTIIYNANGGSGAPSSQTFTGTSSSIVVTLSGVIPVRSGYNFLGWSTSPTATAAQYTAGTTYYNWYGTTSGSYSTTLYAVWQAGVYYATLSFNANGGTGAPSAVSGSTTNADRYVTLTIPYTTPVRDGYTFVGWAENAAGTGTIRQPGGTYTAYGASSGNSYTLYAVWLAATDGGVRFWYNGAWKKGSLYVIYNGAWKKGTIYQWYNGAWKKGQ